jgi:hypothetical protein
MKKIFVKSFLFSLILGLIVPAYSQLANSPWPMFRYDTNHTGRSDYLEPTKPTIK